MDWGFRRGGLLQTPFEKGKPVERPGRKATGLRADPPRQLLLAGLPKEETKEGPEWTLPTIQGGSPELAIP